METMDGLKYIFCSKCGNRIKSDSIYCKYCGIKIADEKQIEISVLDNLETSHENDINKNDKGDETIKVNAAKKVNAANLSKNSIIANEIVANVKMIGDAVLLWVVYILGFMVYHLNDSAPITAQEPYFGQSCYDPVMVRIPSGYELDWEECLYDKIYKIDSNRLECIKYLISLDSQVSYLERAKEIAKIKGVNEEQFEQYKQAAIKKTEKDRNSYYEFLTDIRQTAYKEDLYKNMKLAAVISLCLMIFGRYFILVFKWVKKNKT